MKKSSFILTSILIILLCGCGTVESVNNENDISKYEIIIEERLVEGNEYEGQEINQSSKTEEIISILKSADWEENVQVNMPVPPNYKLKVKMDNSILNYFLWRNPDSKIIEVTLPSNSKYVKLNIDNSAKLHKLITDIN